MLEFSSIGERRPFGVGEKNASCFILGYNWWKCASGEEGLREVSRVVAIVTWRSIFERVLFPMLGKVLKVHGSSQYLLSSQYHSCNILSWIYHKYSKTQFISIDRLRALERVCWVVIAYLGSTGVTSSLHLWTLSVLSIILPDAVFLSIAIWWNNDVVWDWFDVANLGGKRLPSQKPQKFYSIEGNHRPQRVP